MSHNYDLLHHLRLPTWVRVRQRFEPTGHLDGPGWRATFVVEDDRAMNASEARESLRAACVHYLAATSILAVEAEEER